MQYYFSQDGKVVTCPTLPLIGLPWYSYPNSNQSHSSCLNLPNPTNEGNKHKPVRGRVGLVMTSPSWEKKIGKRVLFHRAHHVAPPCFSSSPERTNQTLALKRAFCIFRKFRSHRRFSDTVGRGGGGVFSWLQSATSPLDATRSFKRNAYND